MSTLKHLSPNTGKIESCSSPTNCPFGGSHLHINDESKLMKTTAPGLAAFEHERRIEFAKRGYENPVPLDPPAEWSDNKRTRFYNAQNAYLSDKYKIDTAIPTHIKNNESEKTMPH